VQAFLQLAGDSATPDMLWTPMDMKSTVAWLRSNIEQFDADEQQQRQQQQQQQDGQKGLLYVRT
jgi:prolyl oligopeptidase PreP (S9A serine peptidase family)